MSFGKVNLICGSCDDAREQLSSHRRVYSVPRVKGEDTGKREGVVWISARSGALRRSDVYKGRSCTERTGSCTRRLMSCDCSPTHRAVNSQSALTWTEAMRGAARLSSQCARRRHGAQRTATPARNRNAHMSNHRASTAQTV